jgi:hypothetical protein
VDGVTVAGDAFLSGKLFSDYPSDFLGGCVSEVIECQQR